MRLKSIQQQLHKYKEQLIINEYRSTLESKTSLTQIRGTLIIPNNKVISLSHTSLGMRAKTTAYPQEHAAQLDSMRMFSWVTFVFIVYSDFNLKGR